jgi:hypothetical protein
MSLRRVVGLDAIDLILHFGLTAVIMGGFIGTGLDGEEAAVIGSMVLGTSLVVLGIRRTLALRKLRREENLGLPTGEAAAQRIAELEQRVTDLESAQNRVYELEERLDFTERLLTREAEQRKLPVVEAPRP